MSTPGYDLPGFVFSDACTAGTMHELREFAATRGVDWRSPNIQAAFALQTADMRDFLRDTERWVTARKLEREREEIVESIPWAD